AVVDGAVVRIGVLRIDLLDPEPALHLLEVRAEHLRRERETLGAAPVLENVIGSAVARRPVHDGTAADSAPLQHLDGEVGRRPVAAVLVEARVRRRLLHVEVRLGVAAAFLEHHHLRAGARETGRHHRAARTAPDDADVGFQHHVLVAVRPDHWRAPSTDFTSSYGGPGYPTLAYVSGAEKNSAQQSRFIAWYPVRCSASRDVCQRRRCASCCSGDIAVKGRGGPPCSALKSALSKSASSRFRSLRSFSGSGARNASARAATAIWAGVGPPDGFSSASTRSATAAQIEYSAGVKNRRGRCAGSSRSLVLRSASGTEPAMASRVAPTTLFFNRRRRDSGTCAV